MKKTILHLLIALILTANAFAIGLSPAGKQIEYKTGVQYVDYYLVNSEQKDQTAKIVFEGNLAEYASLENNIFDIKKENQLIPFKIKIDFLENHVSGKIIVSAYEITENNEQISAQIKISSTITVIPEVTNELTEIKYEQKNETELSKEMDSSTPTGGASATNENIFTGQSKAPYALYIILAILVAVFLVTSVVLLKKPKEDKIQKYIDDSRKNNVSDSEIKNQLLTVGWKEEDLKKYFR
jgi:preprotein translocase subunit SecG